MADIFTGPIKLTGDAGKFPRISFHYRVVDSQTQQKTLLDRNTNLIVFPDIIDSLTPEQKINLYYYLQQWFLDKDILELNKEVIAETREIDDPNGANTKRASSLLLKTIV